MSEQDLQAKAAVDDLDDVMGDDDLDDDLEADDLEADDLEADDLEADDLEAVDLEADDLADVKGDESLEALGEEELADDDEIDGTEFLDAEVGEDDDDDEDEDLDEDADADDEDELDELLEEDDEVQPLDEEDGPVPKAKPRRKPELISDDEFTCRNCFLVKKPSQLADADAMFCFDCV